MTLKEIRRATDEELSNFPEKRHRTGGRQIDKEKNIFVKNILDEMEEKGALTLVYEGENIYTQIYEDQKEIPSRAKRYFGTTVQTVIQITSEGPVLTIRKTDS